MRTFVFNCPFSPGRFARGLFFIAAVLLNGACAFNKPGEGGVSSPLGQAGHIEAEPPETAAGANGDVESYLETVTGFSSGNSEHRKAVYERASVAAALRSSADNRLRLALLKLLPGHHGYNPGAAQTLLRSVVEQPENLSAGAVNLATVYLQLAEEHTRLRSANRVFEKQLKEANAKLEALTQIEQSVDPSADEPLGEPSDE